MDFSAFYIEFELFGTVLPGHPALLNERQPEKDSYSLCFNGFNVGYSGVSKTPLWVAEALTPKRLSQKIPREDNFHEETRLNAAHRATLADYRGSGYDRGHMAPNADMPNKAAQSDSFAGQYGSAGTKEQSASVARARRSDPGHCDQAEAGRICDYWPGLCCQKLKTIGKGVIVPTAVQSDLYAENWNHWCLLCS